MCGVHPFYVPRSDPDKIDVNARCLDGFETLAHHAQAVRWPQLGGGDDKERAVALNEELAMNTSALDGVIRDGQHRQLVRVYYEDTDFSGIVYHASYLRFMERGRTNYLRLLGADQRALFEEVEKEAPGFAFVVRSMQIDFRKPARMDDVLEIDTAPLEVKGASVVLHQTRGSRRRDPGRGHGPGRLRVRRPGEADSEGAARRDEGRRRFGLTGFERPAKATFPARKPRFRSAHRPSAPVVTRR